MRLVAITAALALTGCSLVLTSSRPTPAPDGHLVCKNAGLPALELLVTVFAALTTAGIVYKDRELGQGGAIALGVTLASGAAGYVGTRRAEHCDERRGAASERAWAAADADRRRRENLERARATAWMITQQAATAARAGDCQPALDASARVSELDADFHAQVFSRDAAIHRCLQPTGAP